MPGPFIARLFEENKGYQRILLVCKKNWNRLPYIFHLEISFNSATIQSGHGIVWKVTSQNTNPGGGNMIHAFNICRHCLDSPQKKTPRSCLIRLHLTVDLNGHSITFLNANQFAKCFKYLSQSVSTAVLLTELKHQSNEFQDTAGVYVSQEC